MELSATLYAVLPHLDMAGMDGKGEFGCGMNRVSLAASRIYEFAADGKYFVGSEARVPLIQDRA